jgi:myo-inositol 2-dehydrogenase/D-chiro-inositol 1-dehydrogenase
MSQPSPESRRQFIKKGASAGALGALAISANANVAGSDIIKVGLIGGGGRGRGAAVQALNADPGCRLTALGEAFADRAESCLKTLKNDKSVGDRVLVDADSTYVGFDAYKHVIDNVDVVILTTSPHFRPEHLKYAVDKGKHCFVEKPIAVDAPGVRSVQETCKLAEEKGLSIVSGLCWRYDMGVNATMDKIKEGAIGDIIAIESIYNTGTLWHRGDQPDWSRMEYQMRNWLYYTWLSGDHINEQAIHSLDKTAWLNGDAHPVRAIGLGGRQQRTDPKFGHIFDHHSVTYEYANGVRVYFSCRQQKGCANGVDERVLGTKGQAMVLGNRITGETDWGFRMPRGQKKPSMYQVEHDELFKAIRAGKPINNGHYMCNSTMIAIMGRMACYTGKSLTWDQCLNSNERLGPTTYEWGDMPEPEVAIPGITPFA